MGFWDYEARLSIQKFNSIIMIKRISILSFVVLAFSGVTFAWQVSGYNFEKGDTFIVETEANQSTVLTMMGQEVVSGQVVVASAKFEVLEVNGSEFTFNSTTMSMKVNMSGPGSNITIDSEGQTENDKIFSILKGKSYQFTITRTGEVLSITGVEEIQQALAQELQGTPLAMIASQILQGLSENSTRVQLENQFAIYPDEPTEQWTKTDTREVNGLPVNMTSEFLFAGDTELIVSSEITIKGSFTNQGQQMEADMTGTAERTLTLDPATGICTSMESNQSMEGTVVTQGMSIPIKVSSDSKITATKQ